MAKKNKMDITNFTKAYDMFGLEAAQSLLNDVNEGKIRESTVEKYLYDESESKEEYEERLIREMHEGIDE